MQQIKLAKDYSTISTVASAPNNTIQNEKSVVDHLKTSLGQLGPSLYSFGLTMMQAQVTNVL
jgi:hypothetical protein